VTPKNVGRLVFREVVVVQGKAPPRMIDFGKFGRDHEDGDEREIRKKNESDHHKLLRFCNTSRVCET
jgi:hypothetical protein